jgi:hypothetical protein
MTLEGKRCIGANPISNTRSISESRTGSRFVSMVPKEVVLRPGDRRKIPIPFYGNPKYVAKGVQCIPDKTIWTNLTCVSGVPIWQQWPFVTRRGIWSQQNINSQRTVNKTIRTKRHSHLNHREKSRSIL